MQNRSNDIKLLLTLLNNAGVKASVVMDAEHLHVLDLNIFLNTDGSFRWLWPAESRNAGFLRFYNASSAKAKLFAGVASKTASLGLGGLLARTKLRLYIHHSSVATLTSWGQDFSIFTGTTGPNRKGVIAMEQNGEGAFIKSGLIESSLQLIHQEAAQLSTLNTLSLEKMRVPQVLACTSTSASFEDISSPDAQRSNELLPQHYMALAELQSKTASLMPLNQIPLWTEAMEQLNLLQNSTDQRIPKGLLRKLSALANHLCGIRNLPCSYAHGDFTPWNMYVEKNRVAVYDWELAQAKAPLLWDAYHFIIQSGILIGRKPVAEISKQLHEMENSGWVKNLKTQYNLNTGLQRMLYLLLNTTYYLGVYSRQSAWHIQVEWLLQSWSALLNEVLLTEGLYTQRELLCMDLFDQLQGKQYATLKWISPLPERLPAESDIDLCIAAAQKQDTLRFLEQHNYTGRMLKHEKSFMTAVTLLLKDGSLLSIDLIHQFKRRSLQMLNASDVLQQRQILPCGVQVPSAFHTFSYTWLFYTLNGATVPEKYKVQYENQSPEFYTQFKQQWGIDLSLTLTTKKENATYAMEQLLQEPANKGWNRIRNRINYCRDMAGELFNRKGMVITFSGVDGAGKSTVIENVKQHIDKKLRRKVVVLRHRPSLLPILSAWKHGKAAAEEKAARTLPRQGSNKNSASSLFRFAYYYADYFFGQFYIQCKYVWRGYVVLYDRYYFDFINDSRRSNIQLSPAFTAWGYRLLLKPDYNFFLYAQPEEILRRKQELDADTIRELTGKYLHLFQGLSKQYQRSRYIPIHNQELELTLNTIYQQIEKRA